MYSVAIWTPDCEKTSHKFCYDNTMKWQPSNIIKVYEALGSLADGRVEVSGNSAKVYSSSGNKYYDVIYDPATNAITSNDNASYYVGYLGYPSICLLLALGVVDHDDKLGKYLKGFMWKDINQKFKNDFGKTQAYIDEQIVAKHQIDLDEFHASLQKILDEVNGLKLDKLAATAKPPKAY